MVRVEQVQRPIRTRLSQYILYMTDVFVKTLEETNQNLISNNEDEITMNELLKYRACKKIMSLI
jgi:hypothetical protein